MGIGGATAVNGSLVITFTNGSTAAVPLPPGEEGDDVVCCGRMD